MCELHSFEASVYKDTRHVAEVSDKVGIAKLVARLVLLVVAKI